VKKFIKFLIFDLIIVLISFIYFLRMTKTVDVEWTPDDYESGITKTKVEVSDINYLNIENILNDNLLYYGENRVQNSFSNKEVSAILSSANDTTGPISNIKVKFLANNEVEANFILKKSTVDFLKQTAEKDPNAGKYVAVLDVVVDTPMYIKGKLNSYDDYTIDATIESIYLGNIQLGEDTLEKVQTSIVPFINLMILKYKGLSIEQLNIKQDMLEFIGTLPSIIDKK